MCFFACGDESAGTFGQAVQLLVDDRRLVHGVDDGLAQLRAELAPLSATRLLKRAEEVGDIDEAQIDAADEADDRKQALTALLIAHHQHKKQQQQVEIPSQLQAEFCEVPILEDEV